MKLTALLLLLALGGSALGIPLLGQEGGATVDPAPAPLPFQAGPMDPQSAEAFPGSFLRPPGLPRGDEAIVLTPGSPGLDARLRIVHWPGDEERARRVLAVLEENQRLPGLPPEVPRLAVFFLAPDTGIWNALTGGQVPEWGAGVAIPSRRTAVIPMFDAPWGGVGTRDRTILHEWAHLGLHDYLEGLRIPRWFDEGYAQWASGGWNVQESWRLRVALTRGSAPPLDSLVLAWPQGRGRAELAYLLSASAVEYLVAESGTRGMEVFLTRWREAGDFEDAFRRTFGFTTGTFETRWIEHVKRRYGWVLVLYQTAAFWLFGGIAILVLVRVRKRRDLERMARLRASDPPVGPPRWETPASPPVGGFATDRERAGRAGFGAGRTPGSPGGSVVDPDRPLR